MSSLRDTLLAKLPATTHAEVLTIAMAHGIQDANDPLWALVVIAWQATQSAEGARQSLAEIARTLNAGIDRIPKTIQDGTIHAVRELNGDMSRFSTWLNQNIQDHQQQLAQVAGTVAQDFGTQVQNAVNKTMRDVGTQVSFAQYAAQSACSDAATTAREAAGAFEKAVDTAIAARRDEAIAQWQSAASDALRKVGTGYNRKWTSIGAAVAGIVLIAVGALAWGFGHETGYSQGTLYNRELQLPQVQKDLLWLISSGHQREMNFYKTIQGQRLYRMVQTNGAGMFLNCKSKGWRVIKGHCYANYKQVVDHKHYPGLYGWKLPPSRFDWMLHH